ncbi:MAG: hypothetical protein GY904_09230 [Planctomycetaceae bacterium]|nr:hypothetical protein [Planctomycetaceae bacterium]
MWWLDDNSFDTNHHSNWRFSRGVRQTNIQPIKQTKKRRTLLSSAEIEANKRLLEAGTSDDSLAPQPKTSPLVEPIKRNSVAEIKRRYEARIDHLRGIAQEQERALNHQLAQKRTYIGDQAHDREFARVQLARLRKLLLEAEQKITERDQQLIELRRELDENAAEATGRSRDQQQIHDAECSYLKSMNSDVERRATKLEQEVKKLRQYTQRLTANHRDQLNETRRECRTELEALAERLASSERECADLREALTVEQEHLEESNLKREQQIQQIAALTQKCQIAEQIIRQTQRESDIQAQQDASLNHQSRAA